MRFSLGYAFRSASKETFFIACIIMVIGVLPYGSSYLLGKLVSNIVLGVKSGSYTGIYYLLLLYALFNALPTILSNIRLYISRNWQLKLTNEIEISRLERMESIDIATWEDPKFQDLNQRAFRNGPYVIFQLAAGQLDILQAITSLVFGTILAVHFSLGVYLLVIISAIPSFFVDLKYAFKGWNIWAKDSPAQRRFADLRQHILYKIPLIETKLLQSCFKTMPRMTSW